MTGVLAAAVFSVFFGPSVVKAFSIGRPKERFNTESTEVTEKRLHDSPAYAGPSAGRRITDFMGRTVPTFRQLIDDAIARWSKFRRALRREDQEYFDRLFRRVRLYTQAATYQASDNPMEAILLSIALDQEKRLDALERAAQPAKKVLEQLDVPRSPDENEQPDTHQRPDTNQRMDSRSLPEPARDEALADRAEPDAPPAD